MSEPHQDKLSTKLEKVSRWLDSYGGETKGIHRYLPEERDTNVVRSLIKVSGLWLSACGGLTSMSSFFLGPLLFGLGYKDTLICGLFGMWVGCLVAAYCSTMGPRLGLRQMCGARYLFGPYGVKFVSLVTIVGYLGWSVTNCVLAGEILKWMSHGSLDLEVGVAISSVITLCIALFGIKYVLKFEGLTGIPIAIVVLLLYIIKSHFSTWLTQ
ncbi:unnamed protein product [Ambrosiozyma monospora]|uniref:Unnamed protein product n=1 Tax=Ambrosiozyma monospora TaxID=43982 RepID=A0ACB5T9K0_AMBMO|nr:unnamed protein product [Ambrosiozyma monospora]